MGRRSLTCHWALPVCAFCSACWVPAIVRVMLRPQGLQSVLSAEAAGSILTVESWDPGYLVSSLLPGFILRCGMEGGGEMDFWKGRWILSFDCYDSNPLTASGNKLYLKKQPPMSILVLISYSNSALQLCNCSKMVYLSYHSQKCLESILVLVTHSFQSFNWICLESGQGLLQASLAAVSQQPSVQCFPCTLILSSFLFTSWWFAFCFLL